MKAHKLSLAGVGFPNLMQVVGFSCLVPVMGGRRRAWGHEPRGRAGASALRCPANFSFRGSMGVIVTGRVANAENSKQVGQWTMLMDIVRDATACLVKHPQ